MLQVTYNDADRLLLDMADAAQQNSNYDQRVLGTGCGTPACMLGTYAWQHPGSTAHAFVDIAIALRKGRPEASSENAIRLGQQLIADLGITIDQWSELFGSAGCGGALHDGIAAAAYVREFVRKRALARIEQ